MPVLNVYPDGSVSRTYGYSELMNPELLGFIKRFLSTRFAGGSIYSWIPTSEDHMVLFFKDSTCMEVSFMFQFKLIENVFYLYSIASAPGQYRIPGFARKCLINWISSRQSHYMSLGISIDSSLQELERLSTLYSGLGFNNPSPSNSVGPYYYSTPQIKLTRTPDTPVDSPKNTSSIQNIMNLVRSLRKTHKIE